MKTGHEFAACIFTAIISCCLLAGCSSSKFDSPEVTVLAMKKVNMNLFGGEADMRVKLSNPNAEAIKMTGIRIELTTNGKLFSRATAPLDVTIPAYGNAEAIVPATMSNIAMLRTAYSASKTGKVVHGYTAKFSFTDTAGNSHTTYRTENGKMDMGFLQGIR